MMNRSFPILFLALLICQSATAGRFGSFYAENQTANRQSLLEKAGYAAADPAIKKDPEFWTVAEIRVHIAEVNKLTDEVRELNTKHPEILGLSATTPGLVPVVCAGGLPCVQNTRRVPAPVSKSMSRLEEQMLFAMDDEESGHSDEPDQQDAMSSPVESQNTQAMSAGSEAKALLLQSESAKLELMKRFRELRRRAKRLVKLFGVLEKAEQTEFHHQAYNQGQGETLVANLQFLERAIQNVRDVTLNHARFLDWGLMIQTIVTDLDGAHQEAMELAGLEGDLAQRQAGRVEEGIVAYSPPSATDSLSVSPFSNTPADTTFSFSPPVSKSPLAPKTTSQATARRSASPLSQGRSPRSSTATKTPSRAPTPTRFQTVSPGTSPPLQMFGSPLSSPGGTKFSPSASRPLSIPTEAGSLMPDPERSVIPSDPKALLKKSLKGKGRFDHDE